MATRALFEGDPIVIVYPDGHKLLVQPEQTYGFARWSRAAVALLLALSASTRALCGFPLALTSRLATRAAIQSRGRTVESD